MIISEFKISRRLHCFLWGPDKDGAARDVPVLDISDLEDVLSSEHLFIRKVQAHLSETLLSAIDPEHI